MLENDWNNLGREVKDIVQHALDTGDFGALNRDLGATLENALGNVAKSMKDAAGNAGMNRGGDYNYHPYGHYRSYAPSSERMRRARKEFALFENTNVSRIIGSVFTIFGGVMAGVCGLLALLFGLVGATAHVDGMGAGAIVCGIMAVLFFVVTTFANNLRNKVKRFRSYVKTLNGKQYASIKELAKSVRKSEKFVLGDIQKMIEKRMFLEGHIDKNGTCLIVSDEAYEMYLETEKNAEEQRKRERENPKAVLSEEAKKVIEEGKRYIEEVRRSNDAIPGVEVSNKIYHLENVLMRIFKRVEQHPELIDDLHKFMDYYLPTTMKLLNAYEELDKQEVEGENIKTAKQEIENTLDTINVAFENLLDSFYKETVWDVSSDISVLKAMLAQEGLTGENDFQRKE